MKIRLPHARVTKVLTGIRGFDEITDGGLPRGRTTLVMGGPGCGKTVFALQSLVNGAHGKMEAGIFVAFEESARQIVANAATFGWDLPTLQKKKLFFLDACLSPEIVKAGEFDLLGMLTDTGSGMTKETQRRLFEPFFTTKESGKGTGLGLSTTYGIVKQSKGYIWVDSELGRGTTFTVYLPRATADIPARLSPAGTAPVKRASETVLLVEDEIGVRLLSKRFLENAGYQVLEAANGDDAERLFGDRAETINLLVTDVMMPGCGGPELLRRLQVHKPALRVLYMSGYTEQSAVAKGGIDPDLPFVQKPFTAADFVRQVRRALDR